MSSVDDVPPGHPGIAPRWTSSAKSGVGTAVSRRSRVWFAISHGIVNEVYYPSVDQANVRDFGLLVTDGVGFFSEEKRGTSSEVAPIAQGVPGYRFRNTCNQGRYRIVKTVIADPNRDVLLQQVRFEPLRGCLADYKLFALLAPHIGNRGFGNNGWAGDYKGIPMLFAQRDDTTLALGCSAPIAGMSCGYVGVSDGWQDIKAHSRMTWFYRAASDGNIALIAEIDMLPCDGSFVLALGFGGHPAEAGQHARAGMLQDFDLAQQKYVSEWRAYQSRCVADLGAIGEGAFDLYRTSTAVLKTHHGKVFPGAIIASLSVPWGFSKGDNDLGGYHLVWPRDLVESAMGLIAAGDMASARETLFYLMCTQEDDGHWPQNMWLDGTGYWNGIQMDETALPILLADALFRLNELDGYEPWPMVRREEDGGYSPFTLAAEVAGLLAAADFAQRAGDGVAADYLRETADAWEASIERWTYVADTDLSREVGVAGYYVRISPADPADGASPAGELVPIKNRATQANVPCAQIVGLDAIALVRFGLRAADDPRIVDTVKVIDAILKTDTATGPVWHRYNLDGYGEHDDGAPFDGTGRGRGWPLLAGERAHYELARGDVVAAERLRRVMEAQAGRGGLIPEQVWDGPDLPDRALFNGRPSGSAMPLVWAHAEYVKLLRSLRDGRVFDTPPQTVKRYLVDKVTSPRVLWRFNQKVRTMPSGKLLRVELSDRAIVHWSVDDWRNAADAPTVDTTMGIHCADLPTNVLSAGARLLFTFFWPADNRWEGANFAVEVCQPLDVREPPEPLSDHQEIFPAAIRR